MREETNLLLFRRVLFWFLAALFFVFTPLIVLYSLGYKFDKKRNVFVKTGALFVKTFPAKAKVYFGGKVQCFSPCTLRNLMPAKYQLKIEKKGFYPYNLTLEVEPSKIKSLEIALLPEIAGFKKAEIECNVHKFFYVRHLFKENILAFSDCGLYALGADFKSVRRLCRWEFSSSFLNSICGLRENNKAIVFWNHNSAFLLKIEAKNLKPQLIYKTNEQINDVFFALDGRYIIIWDGLSILALNTGFPQDKFSLYRLKSVKARVFYSASSGTLYVKDKAPSGKYYLFQAKLSRLIYGKEKN